MKNFFSNEERVFLRNNTISESGKEAAINKLKFSLVASNNDESMSAFLSELLHKVSLLNDNEWDDLFSSLREESVYDSIPLVAY